MAGKAATYADVRPVLDQISRQAIGVSAETRAPEFYLPAPAPDAENAPEAVPWAPLIVAPSGGTITPDRMADTGSARAALERPSSPPKKSRILSRRRGSCHRDIAPPLPVPLVPKITPAAGAAGM